MISINLPGFWIIALIVVIGFMVGKSLEKHLDSYQ